MTLADIDQFFLLGTRTLPAAPDWRDGNRVGERRASLSVASSGVVGPVTLEITIRLADARYLMMLLLCRSGVICRLCMTTGHRDRLTKMQVNEAHFHSWEANRVGRKSFPKSLNQLEIVPAEIVSRDAAFIWFLQRNGIQIPSWAPGAWPSTLGML